jgi:hypothetical protein
MDRKWMGIESMGLAMEKVKERHNVCKMKAQKRVEWKWKVEKKRRLTQRQNSEAQDNLAKFLVAYFLLFPFI